MSAQLDYIYKLFDCEYLIFNSITSKVIMDLTKIFEDSYKKNECQCQDLFDFLNNTLNPIQDLNEKYQYFYGRLHTIAVYYGYMVSAVHTFEFFSRIKQFKLASDNSVPDIIFASNSISFYIFADTLIETLDFTIKNDYPLNKVNIYQVYTKYNNLKNNIHEIRNRFVHAKEGSKNNNDSTHKIINKISSICLGDPDGGEDGSFVTIRQISFKQNIGEEYKLIPRVHLNNLEVMLSELGRLFENDFKEIKEQNKDKYKFLSMPHK
jgi:hypothetical protein